MKKADLKALLERMEPGEVRTWERAGVTVLRVRTADDLYLLTHRREHGAVEIERDADSLAAWLAPRLGFNTQFRR